MSMETLIAYHNDQALKDRTLAQIEEHRQLDQIVQGQYWRNGDGKPYRGCAVGCLTHDPDGGHDQYETRWGIPVQLAWLEDGIFEALPTDTAAAWPGRFLAAIPVGADLASVWPRYAIWLMTDPEWGLEHVTGAEDVKEVCRRVAGGYEQIIADGISDEDAQAITDAAWDAWDAWAARDARAARAAWAAWAARDARAAWAAWAARDAFIQASADKLIELLTNAPVIATVAR